MLEICFVFQKSESKYDYKRCVYRKKRVGLYPYHSSFDNDYIFV